MKGDIPTIGRGQAFTLREAGMARRDCGPIAAARLSASASTNANSAGPWRWSRDVSRCAFQMRNQVSSSRKSHYHKNNLRSSFNLRCSLAGSSFEQHATPRTSLGALEIIDATELAMRPTFGTLTSSVRPVHKRQRRELIPTTRVHLTATFAMRQSFLPGSKSPQRDLERATGTAPHGGSRMARRDHSHNSCQPIRPWTKGVMAPRKLPLFAGGRLLSNLPLNIAWLAIRAQARLHSRSVWEAAGTAPVRLTRRLIV